MHGRGSLRLTLAFLVASACLLAMAAASAPRAHAQAPGPEPGAADAAEGASASVESAQAEAHAATIVFVLPTLDASSESQLRDALLAQFALVDAELELRDEPASEAGAPLHRRMAAAQELAEQHGALAVLWLETEPLGRWFVHVLDVAHERVVVRRVDARDAQRPAAIEAVAVMAREAARAVLAGDPAPSAEGSTLPAPRAERAEPALPPEAEPTAPEAQAPAEPSTSRHPLRARLSLGYVGTDFAPEVAFSHGLAFTARAELAAGAYLGLGIGWAGPIEPSDADTLRVYRIPGQVFAGYRATLLSWLDLDVELGLLLEALRRRAAPEPESTPDTTRFLAGLSPRARVEWRPWPVLGVYLGGGLDLLFTNLRYEARDPDRAVLLRPSWLRPAVEAGLALHP